MASSSVQSCALKVSVLVISALASVCSQNENRIVNECRNPNEECVEIIKCPAVLNTLNEHIKGATVIPPEFREMLRNLHCGWETKTPKICCINVEKELQPVSPKPVMDVLIKYTGIHLFPSKENCGPIGEAADKILGGNETHIGEFPWMALLSISKGDVQRYHCGGALINNRYIITAAHCVHMQNLKHVRLGEWDLSSETDCVQNLEGNECNDLPVDVEIEKTIVHPYYKLAGHSNDIALLRLAKQIDYTQWIRPICMPFSSKLRKNEYKHKEQVTISGWGRTETRPKSSRKLKVKIPVEKFEDCRVQYKRANITLTDRQMCAGGEPGKDSCSGDSGGPLMSLMREEESVNWYLIGITSYGPAKCATPGWPGIYTKVGPYIDWILSQVEQ